MENDQRAFFLSSIYGLLSKSTTAWLSHYYLPKTMTGYINGVMLECYFEAPCEYAQSRGTLAETKWPFDVGPPLSKSVPKQSTFVFPSFNPK